MGSIASIGMTNVTIGTRTYAYTPKEWTARKSLLSKIPPMIQPGYGYELIYSDPPWSYRDSANSGNRGAIHKYDTLSLPELKVMRPEIDSIAYPDCALALWATAPMIREALALIEAWGFKYSTILMTWIKTVDTKKRVTEEARRQGFGEEIVFGILEAAGVQMVRPRKGMGNWTRSNAEFLLLGTRGKVERINKGVGSVIITEPREHSRKPDEARDRLIELFGNVSALEMFSRASAPGWASWGLEVGKLDQGDPK